MADRTINLFVPSDGLEPRIMDKLNWNLQVLAKPIVLDGKTVEVIKDNVGSGQAPVDPAEIIQNALLASYPIGSIIWTDNMNDSRLGIGTHWEQITDVFLFAAGGQVNLGETGGEFEHTLTIDEMPAHTHKYYENSEIATIMFEDGGSQLVHDNQIAETGETGGGQPHNNMPPYLGMYCFRRTA